MECLALAFFISYSVSTIYVNASQKLTKRGRRAGPKHIYSLTSRLGSVFKSNGGPPNVVNGLWTKLRAQKLA